MESVNTWIAVAVGVITVLAGVAAMLRGAVHALDSRIDSRLDAQLRPMEQRLTERIDSGDKVLGERIDGVEKALGERIDMLGQRMDRFDTKLDHVAEVVDLRLKPLEEDVALIKRHILGLPAA